MRPRAAAPAFAAALAGCAFATGCASRGDAPAAAARVAPVAPVAIVVVGPNAVTTWSEIAAATIAAPPDASGSAAEQRPNMALDLATMHLAIDDALTALGTSRRAGGAASPSDTAAEEAAVPAAACATLQALYPNRAALYRTACEAAVAALPPGDASARGLALGAAAAQQLIARRGDDGRTVALAPYVPGSAPGQFRGAAPINRQLPYTRPLVLASMAPFRAPPPPVPGSQPYAAAFDETRALGGTASTARTGAQFEAARFHTESPLTFWPRNLRRLAMTNAPLAEHTRLLALLFTAQADAEIACFDSKYAYDAWRPITAFAASAPSGGAEPAWAPVLPTPNHPEYPAAHSCVSAAVAAALSAFHGTRDVSFTFDSTATSTTRRYASPQALVDEVQAARIAGGMHFRFSTDAGAALGRRVGEALAAARMPPR